MSNIVSGNSAGQYLRPETYFAVLHIVTAQFTSQFADAAEHLRGDEADLFADFVAFRRFQESQKRSSK